MKVLNKMQSILPFLHIAPSTIITTPGKAEWKSYIIIIIFNKTTIIVTAAFNTLYKLSLPIKQQGVFSRNLI